MIDVSPRLVPEKTSNAGTSVHPETVSLASECSVDTLPDRYITDVGSPVTWEEGTRRYRNHRLGEEASAEANGYQGGLQTRARKKCGAIYKADRKFRADFVNPIIGFATFVGSYCPVNPEYGPILDYEQALAEAINQATQTVRYRLRQYQRAEYVLIEGGTGTNGVPHWHLAVWVDEADHTDLRPGLEAIVCRVQAELPSSLREFQPEEGNVPSEAVQIDSSPNIELKMYPSDPKGEPAHPIARYVANQLPHLGNADPEMNSFDGMSEEEAQFGAIADASPTRDFRSSSGVSTI